MEYEREPEEMWEPIETAPRDGTFILTWQHDIALTSRWNDYPEGGGGWFEMLNDEYEVWPTHWMPLPDPPRDRSNEFSLPVADWRKLHSGGPI